MKSKVLFVFLFLLETALPAQTSGTRRFDDVKGTRVLTAAHEKNKIFVTCSHTDDDRSCFLVENVENSVAGVRKKFYTTAHVEPSSYYTCSGYIVNDMKVDNNYQCWFCGTKWVRTGQYIYNTQGLLVPDTVRCGYIGRFNLDEVLNGGGNLEIMTIDGCSNVEHFAFTEDGGIYATGEMMVYKIYPSTTGYSVEKGVINHTNLSGQYVGRFMDVVVSGDTVITLALCVDSGHYFHYHDYLFLSYGTAGSFITDNNTHPYDTYDAYGDRRTRRWSNAPVFLTKTYRGCGVVVSYITENTDYPLHDFPGKLIMFHVPGELSGPKEIIYNDDTDVYVKIKDIKSCDSLFGSSFMAVLLEDSYGKSVVRFPRVGTGTTWLSDTIRKVQNPKYESIYPFRNPDSQPRMNPSVSVAGYYPQNQNRVARNTKYNVRNENTRLGVVPWNCYVTSYGFWKIDHYGPPYNQKSRNTEFNIVPYGNGSVHAEFVSYQFTSESASLTFMCSEPIPIPIR